MNGRVFVMTISAYIDGRSPDSGHPLPRSDRRLPIWNAVIGLAMLLIVLMAIPGLLRIGGLQMAAVNGHSMGRAVPDQSIVITRSVSGESLRTGDVVVFSARWLDGDSSATNVVHRLSLITPTPAGPVGYTSGDTNVIADPTSLSLHGEVPVVKLVVPYAGIFYGMSLTNLLMGAIGFILALLALTWRVQERSICPVHDARSVGSVFADQRIFVNTSSEAVVHS